MKVGVVILCRYNSTRLPGKILKELEGKTILRWIINSVLVVTSNYIVATSIESSDDIIESYCKDEDIPVYRGDLDNVADRFMNAAKSQSFDYAIRINGDNLFVNQEVLDRIIHKSSYENYDFITNVPDRTYPYGMSVEMINLNFFRKYLKEFDEKYKEHVTLYFYDHDHLGRRLMIRNEDVPEAKGLNLAIDTFQDFEKAQYIINHAKVDIRAISLKELVALGHQFEKQYEYLEWKTWPTTNRRNRWKS